MSKPAKKKAVSKKRAKKKPASSKLDTQKKTVAAETPLRNLTNPDAHVQDTLLTMTFYSFKGGVGRTLALLNVATLLAKLGNRVAIADFDLEAPGLDTYKGFEPPADDQPGVLEFITDYTQSEGLRAPSCKDYLYCVFDQGLHRWGDDDKFGPPKKETHEFSMIKGNGALYVMRAGRQDATYRRNLTRLDWDRLFADQDGQLLFANLKNELFNDYGCNFLLLDSRTGLTDVAGVCTAYLPDAVVLMFYPDDQNARGITTVAQAMRQFEKKEARDIPRMYCVSRVPLIAEVRTKAESLAEEIYDAVHRTLPFCTDAIEPGHWDWDAYLDTLEVHAWEGMPPLRHIVVETGHKGRPYAKEWLTEDRTVLFGGAPVCVLPERPSVDGRLAACSGVTHVDAKPYMRLATFAAALNSFERMRLRFVEMYLHIILKPKEYEECQKTGVVPVTAGRRRLSPSIDLYGGGNPNSPVEYARKWHFHIVGPHIYDTRYRC